MRQKAFFSTTQKRFDSICSKVPTQLSCRRDENGLRRLRVSRCTGEGIIKRA